MDEISQRRKRLFAGAGFSSAIFYNGDIVKGTNASFAYFSGCRVDGSYLVLKKNDGIFFTNEMNLREARKLSHYPVKLLEKDAAKEIKKACGRGKTGFSAVEMTAAKYLALKKRVKPKLVDATEKMRQVRGGKSGSERRALAESAAIARRILAKLVPWKHKTEEGVVRALEVAALSAGAEFAFEPIVATGRDSACPHHKPTAKKLEDFVLVDFGVRHNGYCSDFTRCYFRRKNMEELKAYGKCRAVFEEMKQGLAKCRTGGDVALLSDKLMKKHRLPKMIHSIGHGVGMDVHEYPHLNVKSRDSLKGVVLAIEPAAYFSDFGVRYEEMLVNSAKGWKKL